MIVINLPGGELYDEETECFIYTSPCTLRLEHSLYAISQWEAYWKVPFLDDATQRTPEMLMDYFRCMVIDEDQDKVDEESFKAMPYETQQFIAEYMNDSQTATTISSKKAKRGGKQVITSELIYYWMVASEIPFECQHWHINRLLTLIQVCGEKNNPTKMSKKDLAAQNKSLNAARRAKHNSAG